MASEQWNGDGGALPDGHLCILDCYGNAAIYESEVFNDSKFFKKYILKPKKCAELLDYSILTLFQFYLYLLEMYQYPSKALE